MKEYPEQHAQGTIRIENLDYKGVLSLGSVIQGDIGVQIARDGRVWVCINGVAFLRFSPHKDGKMKKE
jgi:hypothetical protein